MNIVNFTPVSALTGGLLIGLAAALMIVFLGRIAGISGILGGSLGATQNDRLWRVLFVLGIPLGSLIASRLMGEVPFEISTSTPLLIVAGLLVGVGTRIGNGCTSGHGVCGLARGSGRSLSATMVFMGTAALTVWVVRHLLA